MGENISYYPASPAFSLITETTVTTGGQDLAVISDGKLCKQAHISVYAQYTLGTATNIIFTLYFSPDTGTSYYNGGIAISGATKTANTAGTNVMELVLDCDMPANLGWKLYAKSTAQSASLENVYILVRDK